MNTYPAYTALFKAMPNYGGTMQVHHAALTYSYPELSKPTGRYISRALIRLLNMFFKKGFFRHLGNPAIPGMDMPQLDPTAGRSQFGPRGESCGLLLANVAGNDDVTDGIRIAGEPFMVIRINPSWKNFEGYKAGLTSKYRIRTNRVFTLSEAVEKRSLNDEQIDSWLEKCSALLFATIRNKTITIGNDLTAILRGYHSVLGDNYQLTGYFLNNTLIGFIGSVTGGSTMYAMHLGYDVNAGTPLHLYQRMMYDTIAWSIENKVHELNLGRTAPEIKSTLGAVPRDNSFIFFTKSRILQYALKTYATRYHKLPVFVLRHPFKE